MSKVDWRRAPEWANAVIASKDGQEFYVSQFGGISARQRVGYSVVDDDASADMIHPHDWTLIESRHPAWSGEGLPPVGTVCEFAGGTQCPEDPFDKDLKEGMKVTIIAHFKCGDFMLAAFTFDPENPDRGMVQVEQANFGCFRPIRTPEQIAAEKREHNVRNACTAISKVLAELRESEGPTAVSIIEAMIDAGFRKQEGK